MDTITATIKKKDNPILFNVSRLAGKAIVEYQMIQENDRIAVAVSGGKDSVSLLHVLRHRQMISPVDFSFEAVHIDFGISDFDPRRLADYFEQQGFSYIVKKVDGLRGHNYEDFDCYRWSRIRRKAMFVLANERNFNKIAFGHHMDDIAETVILNQFYRGEIGAMKPRQELFDGKMTLIRPLALVRESHMAELARQLKIMNIGQSKCAFDDTSRRMKIKMMIKDFEKTNPALVKNIFKSLKNIQHDYLLDA